MRLDIPRAIKNNSNPVPMYFASTGPGIWIFNVQATNIIIPPTAAIKKGRNNPVIAGLNFTVLSEPFENR